jgi:hypothetical protein
MKKDEGAKSKKDHEILCQGRSPVTLSEWREISTIASDGLWEIKGR